MGYFDAVKTAPPTHAPPATTQTHPYAAAAISAELARLDQCRNTPEGAAPHWDITTFEVACNLIEIANSRWSGYTTQQAEQDHASRSPQDNKFTARHIAAKWLSAKQKVGSTTRPQPSDRTNVEDWLATLTAPTPVAEEEFWPTRDVLAHLHQFAQARRVSPWAMLGATLARIVTATPYGLHLPKLVGSQGSLNLFIGLVGPSGSGKGAAEAAVGDAIALGYIETVKLGSGEGIAHAYMQRVRGTLNWRSDDHAVLFSVSEIDALAAINDRKGSTLFGELRSAWSGERLGFAYADPAKRLPVPAHQYRLTMVAGIQPERAACLLNDSDGGTPQRFIWLPSTDPTAPDNAPNEPEPWAWRMPQHQSGGPWGTEMKVCDVARKTIDEARVQRLRGQGSALDGHALQARLKTAAALALLDQRTEVIDDDWHLASIIMKKSDHTRHLCQNAISASGTKANTARALAEIGRAEIIEEAADERAIKRVCLAIRRHLETSNVTRGDLRRRLAGRDRNYFEQALERLQKTDQIKEKDGHLSIG